MVVTDQEIFHAIKTVRSSRLGDWLGSSNVLVERLNSIIQTDDPLGDHPVHFAVRTGHYGRAAVILGYSVGDVTPQADVHNSNQDNIVHLVAKKGSRQAIRFLEKLKSGLDTAAWEALLEKKNLQGRDPYFIARANGFSQALQDLLKPASQPPWRYNPTDQAGRSADHYHNLFFSAGGLQKFIKKRAHSESIKSIVSPLSAVAFALAMTSSVLGILGEDDSISDGDALPILNLLTFLANIVLSLAGLYWAHDDLRSAEEHATLNSNHFFGRTRVLSSAGVALSSVIAESVGLFAVTGKARTILTVLAPVITETWSSSCEESMRTEAENIDNMSDYSAFNKSF